ncbi:MAG: family transcriptional regulator, cyclic receptor protein [Thermoleophilaceae bacterium]|jgi:CRP-like cAMP-binding protein|nr:family transcriptional regulator, cyclic receptor protein [Thermoleophilaceae bacterium]MEA2368702.1 family transcriptional regulator, cyclic receptor protein [Thermoleophilaceae bacterium]MEA2387885.1 family transcriptional regulator, cyclic receptor protein [Thermoleophilaceae bacterium]
MNAATLDEAPLFASLPDETKRELAEFVSETEVPSGKHLVDQGDRSYNLFVILKGKAEVYKDGQSVAELGPGDFFGEVGTVGDAPRSATVVSTKRTRLLTLGSRDLQRLKESAPQVLEELEKAIAARS